MSVTVVAVGDNKRDVYGATEVAMFDVTFDNSYPAGGYAVVAKTFGLSRPIAGIAFIAVNTAGIVQMFYYNNQTGKIMVLMVGASTAAFADLTPTTNIATMTVRALVFTQR